MPAQEERNALSEYLHAGISQHAFSIIPDLVKIVETKIEGGTASAERVLIRLTDLLAQQLEHPDFDDPNAISPKVVKQKFKRRATR